MYGMVTEITIAIFLQTAVDYLVGRLGIYQSQCFTTRQKLRIALCSLAVTFVSFVYALFFSHSWMVSLVLLLFWYTNTILHFTVNPHLRFLGAMTILEEELWQYLCNLIMPLFVSRDYANKAVQFVE